MTKKFFIIAGEASGDVLGAKLIDEIKQKFLAKDEMVEFIGVGGKSMQEAGLRSIFAMEDLSIMGFVEVLPHLFKILKRINQTADEIIAQKPDFIITIDSPDFNFRVMKKVKNYKGAKKIHLVAPSVWAYREQRARKVAQLYDLLLAILPFEPPYFTKYNLKLDWIVKNISNDFGIPDKDCEEILPNLLWGIGIANLDIEVPVFFARKLRQEEIFDKIKKVLVKRKSPFQGLILTSCSDIPSYFHSKIAGNKIISLKNCLSVNKKDFHIDKGILKTAVFKTSKDGFTTGYRSARFNGEYFRFTKQEADVLEYLHKSGKAVHKDEIMVEVTGSSTELRSLFRSSDSRNIRNNILQHDNKGYYWLNLN